MGTPSSDRSRSVPAGTVIFRQGASGDEMFLIAAGRVSLRLGGEGQEREVAALGPGEFFGELSLLGGMPRTATAVAAADTTLLAVRRDTFALMMQDDLEVVFRMMDALGRRLGETNRHVEELAERLRRTRAGAQVLARCLAAGGDAVAVDAAALARDAQVTVAEAEALMAELAGRGVGRLDAGCWHLDPTHAGALAAALATAR